METSKLHIIRTGILAVNTIIVPCGDKKVFVVDPATSKMAMDENKILDYLHSKKLECVGIVLTHSHFDHITGIAPLKKAFPAAPVMIHEAEYNELQNPPGPMGEAVIQFFNLYDLQEEIAQQPSAEIPLKNNQTLDFIGETGKDWKVIHTPGHTPGSICLYNQKEKLLISGDTIFAYGGYGRTDMAGGNEVQIIRSLDLIRKTIDPDTKIYPGHDQFGFTL